MQQDAVRGLHVGNRRRASRHAQIHGRLFGSPFGKNDAYQFTIFQTYDYIHNPAYDFGGQVRGRGLDSRAEGHWSVWLAATGGATVLAAANSLLGLQETAAGVFRGAPTTTAPGRGCAASSRSTQGLPDCSPRLSGVSVNVVDGTRANHILQRLKLDLRAPVARFLGGGHG
jgi:hypothetical protein